MKVIENRGAFTGAPPPWFDPIRLKLIGSTTGTGRVAPTDAASPKLWPVGAEAAGKPDRNAPKSKESLPFSVKQNNHFNDGLCLDATHNKPARCWRPSGSHFCFWHRGRFFFFFCVYDGNKTV